MGAFWGWIQGGRAEGQRRTTTLQSCSSISLMEPQLSYFKAADWIFEHEKERFQGNTVAERPIPMARQSQSFRQPSPYLINKTLAEPQSRKMLLTALRTNPKSFYYYKKRRLCPPAIRPIRPPSPVSTVCRAKTVLSRPRASSRYQQTPLRTASRSDSGDIALSRLVEKCGEVASSRDLSTRIDRERASLRELSRSLDWTQTTLQDISNCGPELQIPYYLSQKEALSDLHRDVKAAVLAYRQRANPVLGVARFERALRKHRNMIL